MTPVQGRQARRRPAVARWALVAVCASLLAACGTRVETTTREIESTPDTSTAPETPDESPSPDGAGLGAAAAIRSAAAAFEADLAYRVSNATGQTMRLDALDVDTEQPLDTMRPTAVVETAADGSTHVFIDLGPVLGPLFSGRPEAAAAIDATHVEMWQTGDRLVIDATGYQPIADLNPGADLGVFAPGVGEVDLSAVAADRRDGVVAALIGTSVPDPVELARVLPDALDAVSEDAADPGRFIATTTYGRLIEAMGGDLDLMSRSSAAPIASTIGASVEELAGFYRRFFESIDVDVEIRIDDAGVLESVQWTADLSSIFTSMFAPDSGLDFDRSEAELSAAADMFGDAEWHMTGRAAFELDPSIVVTPPTVPMENRTMAMLALVDQMYPS